MVFSDTIKWWVCIVVSTCLVSFIKYVPLGVIFAVLGCTAIILWSEYVTNEEAYDYVIQSVPILVKPVACEPVIDVKPEPTEKILPYEPMEIS
jgi:hypothetical protein